MTKEEFIELLKQPSTLSRTLRFSGEITDASADVLLKQFLELYTKNPDEEIILHITSGGGRTVQCLSFFDIIQTYQPKLFVVVSGSCMSAAVPFLLAAEQGRRFATKHTLFLIHPARNTYEKTRFSREDLEAESAHLESLDGLYANILETRTKMSKKQIRKELGDDKRSTVDQALKWGLIDAII